MIEEIDDESFDVRSIVILREGVSEGSIRERGERT